MSDSFNQSQHRKPALATPGLLTSMGSLTQGGSIQIQMELTNLAASTPSRILVGKANNCPKR